MRYVIDASVALRWFIKECEHPNALSVLEAVVDEPCLFAVPELFAYEVLSVLYRHHPHASTVYAHDVDRILSSGLLRYPMTGQIYNRAERFITIGLTGYDAAYVALAEELEGVWLTFDSAAHNMIKSYKLSIDLNRSELHVKSLK